MMDKLEEIRKRYQGPLMNRDIMWLVSKIERLRKALEYYADEAEWYRCTPDSAWRLKFNNGYFDGDGFLIAQQALKEGK